MKMKVIDLFCGCGGFSKGFEQAGMEVILGVDNWDRACESYQANFPEAEVWQRDVTTLRAKELPEHDILIGSPPCQEFSVARFKNKKLRKQKANRSNVYAFMELVQQLAPRYWVWENVPPVKKAFPQWRSKILDAQDYGVPQRRKRAFFGNYPLPRKVPKQTSLNIISPTIVNEVGGGYRRFSKFISPTITATEYKGCESDKIRAYSKIMATVTRSFPNNIPRAGGTIADFELRRFNNIIEAMKCYQGMDGMIILGNKKEKSIQIGNAVCPPVAKAIAEAILKKERQ